MAQNKPEIKEVYLKDGSFLRGEILEQLDGSHIELRISGDNIVRFEASEILKIITPKTNVTHFRNGKKFFNKGFHGSMKTGIGFANEDYYAGFGSSIFFDLMGEYQFNKHFSVGLGSALDANEFGFLSLYGNVKYVPFVKKTSAYLAASFGSATTVDISSDEYNYYTYRGGLMFFPRVGLQFASRSSVTFFTEVGYRIQRAKRTFEWQETTDNIVYRRLAISLGINF